MYKKIFLILMIILLIATPIYAGKWKSVNYSDSHLIRESGLTIEEFNNLSQSEWLELLDSKENVNFAFSATDSNGKDITNYVNPNLSINIVGLNNEEVVKFTNIEDNNSAPIFKNIKNQVITEGELFSYQLEGADSDEDSLSYTILNQNELPEDITFNKNLIEWQTDYADSGDYLFEVEISDGKDSSVEEFILTVKDYTNQALNFDGVEADDMVIVSHDNQNYSFNNELTLEAWAYPKSTEDEFRFIVNKGDRYNGLVLRHGRTIENDNVVNVRLEINGSMKGLNYYPSNPKDFDNQWNHYAVVYDGNKLKLYVNDILRDETTASGNINLTSEDMYIGHGNINDIAERWYGYIDEVRLWNVAKTQEEIINDKNLSLTGNETGLVHYFDMEDINNNILKDKTGNKDGIIYGAEPISSIK